MKAKMLKIAGVKSEKEFYKKFPTEEAFMETHGKEFKKALRGSKVEKAQVGIRQPRTSTSGWSVMAPQQNAPVTQGPFISPLLPQQAVPQTYTQYAANQFGISPTPTAPSKKPKKTSSSTPLSQSKISPYVQAGQSVLEGVGMIGDEKNAVKQAKQSAKLTGVQALAATSPKQPIKHNWVRPEDNLFQPEQLFPSYGVGTNVLAENGAEIANTFAPGNIYDDGGYEPLNDSNKIKRFADGGETNFDLGEFAGQGGTEFAGQLGEFVGNWGRGPSAGTKIGGGIGQAAGTAFGGPIGGMIGKLAGSALGGALDRSQQKIESYNKESAKNIANMMGQQVQGKFSNYLENGGWVSHDWQPQLITQFGDYNVHDLLKPDETMDTLRAGGHLKSYTEPSQRALQTFAMGGDLKTHWGGYAEPMSYNPFLPDGGETVMFRGQSHDESDGKGNTGIGITYGDSPVEVERGEPAVKLRDGSSGDDSLVVYGNLKIPNQFLSEIGDPKAKGKKFKHYAKELSKTEARQNKIVEKSTEQLNNLDVVTPFDQLKLGSLKANIMGANMKLKSIAEKKEAAARVQNAINDTAEEMGLVADDLAMGKVKVDKEAMKQQAKYGMDVPKAQNGLGDNVIKNFQRALGMKSSTPGFGKKIGPKTLESYKNFLLNYMNNLPKNIRGDKPLTMDDLKDVDVNRLFKDGKLNITPEEAAALGLTPEGKLYRPSLLPLTRLAASKQAIAPGAPTANLIPDALKDKLDTVSKNPLFDKHTLMDLYNNVLPYLRPSDAETLDPNQLTGEMYALSTNELEPVQAQLYDTELSTPYNISLQDMLNENQAAYNATQKQVGYNPAAMAALNAQKYLANQKVLSEQFRMNQAEQQRVYEQNRNIVNQTKLQNLGILDKQYERQDTAKAKTKATTQAALNSISSKIAQNKLENRTLQTYENMYNYRFNPNFRAINMNPLAQFDVTLGGGNSGKNSGGLAPGYEFTYDSLGNIIGTRKSGKSSDTSRNGSIVKALKNI